MREKTRHKKKIKRELVKIESVRERENKRWTPYARWFRSPVIQRSVLLKHLNFLHRFFYVVGSTNERMKRDETRQQQRQRHTHWWAAYTSRHSTQQQQSFDLGLYFTDCVFSRIVSIHWFAWYKEAIEKRSEWMSEWKIIILFWVFSASFLWFFFLLLCFISLLLCSSFLFFCIQKRRIWTNSWSVGLVAEDAT